ncbi:MAG: hypothetical protein J3K34DRAFT_507122 [Monoraphidium minutum]|nr:MAG: hypothetical protein J3K34DRAFT_507122 [Monoraphidium minutum]
MAGKAGARAPRPLWPAPPPRAAAGLLAAPRAPPPLRAVPARRAAATVAAAAAAAAAREPGGAPAAGGAAEAPPKRTRGKKKGDDLEAFVLDEASAAYWRELMEQVSKPHAQEQAAYLDFTRPLGIAPRAAAGAAGAGGVSSGDDGSGDDSGNEAGGGGGRKSVPCYEEYLRYRRDMPRALILMRVGEFFEAVGYDAVLLMEHAGLNAMGAEGGAPRAGCPAASLRRTAAMLVEQGLTVAVVEESEPPEGRGAKVRFLLAVLSPAQPHLLAGLVDDETGAELAAGVGGGGDGGAGGFLAARPIIGVAAPSGEGGGWSLMALDPGRLASMALTGLSEEAMWAHVGALGAAPPLLVHRFPGAAGERDTPREREFRLQVREAMGMAPLPSPGGWGGAASGCSARGAARYYASPDAMAGFISEALLMLGRPADTPVTRLEGSGYLLRPGATVLNSTARQLGLIRVDGVPSLLDHVLPQGAPAQCRQAMRQLLMLPPPPEEAVHLHAATRLLAGGVGCSPPQLVVEWTSDLVARVVLARQCSHHFFLRPPAAAGAAAAAGGAPAADGLLASLRSLEAAVLAVVPPEALDFDPWGGGGDGSEEADEVAAEAAADGGGDDEGDEGVGGGGGASLLAGFRVSGGPGVFGALRARAELHRRVRPEHLGGAAEEVEAAAAEVQSQLDGFAAELAAPWADLVARGELRRPGAAAGARKLGGRRAEPHFVADGASGRVWLRVPLYSQLKHEFDPVFKRLGLHRAEPAKSKCPRGGGPCFTAPRLDAASASWGAAAEAAGAAARARLQELAGEVAPLLPAVGLAAGSSILLQVFVDFAALMLHVGHGLSLGWAHPDLTGPGRAPSAPAGGVSDGSASDGLPAAGSGSGGSRALVLRGVWPYWMDRRGGTADGEGGRGVVANDVELDGMALLTGPNMAGKSTALRTICAAALLANCGLLVPAAGGAAPHFSHYALRNFSGDAPAEGVSAFGVEMRDMNNVLVEAAAPGAAPLVLVDELGKGTDVLAGTALAAAMLEELAASPGVTGVFATHLHLLQALPLEAGGPGRRLAAWRMEVEDDEGWRPLDAWGEPATGGGGGGGESAAPYPLADFGLTPKRPTWRIGPGTCGESLALEAALSVGLPGDVARRAAELLSSIPPYGDMARPEGEAGGGRGWLGDFGGAGGEEGGGAEGRGAGASAAGGGDWLSAVGAEFGTAAGAGGSGIGEDEEGAASSGAWSGGSAASGDEPEAGGCGGTGGGAAAAAPDVAIEDAEPVVAAVLEWLAEQGLVRPPGAAPPALPGAPPRPDGGGGAGAPLPRPLVVRSGRTQVQPADARRPCVYVLRWRGSAFFYGGSSNDLRERLRRHARSGGPLDAAYAPLDGGGWTPLDGALAAAEGELIRRLRDAGFPMKSTRDAARRRRGRA